jgi:vacuolar-type H+-ATPase subunit E/Vma4
MPLKEVIDEVINQANEEAKAIIKHAEQEALEIERKAKLDVEAKTAESEKNAGKAAEDIKKKKVASTKLELKKEIMQEKKAVLEQIVEKAKLKLSEMGEKQREEILKKLIATAKNELSDVKFIECSKTDSAIVKKLVPNADIKITTSVGGIIAANKDRTVQLDLTVERLLEQAKEEYIDEISKRIFR